MAEVLYRRERCAECGGHGRVWEDLFQCPGCGGFGYRYLPADMAALRREGLLAAAAQLPRLTDTRFDLSDQRAAAQILRALAEERE